MALSHHQFRMFIPAHELMSFAPTDINEDDDIAAPYSESHGLLRQKRQENAKEDVGVRESLNKSVARHGVVSPVSISENDEHGVSVILNGHHRIVAAYDANPHMEVPVRNYE